ncbi:MAG: sensor histidine kinase [Gemmatimonadales bacterium]
MSPAARLPALSRAAVRISPFWTAQLLGWTTYAAAKYTLSRALYPSVWRVLLLVAIGAVLSLPLRALYRRLRAAGVSQPVTIGIAVAASFALANVWLLVYDGLLVWRGVLEFEGWSSYAKAVLNKAPVLLAWSALYLGLKHRQDLVAERERSLQATASAREAQLEMLRYQLQPHFLFNALNSLRALIDEDPARARKMVTELSGFLRYSLIPAGATEVPLVEELASIRRYLAIEQVRFESRLQVRFEVAADAEATRVPTFLLHPLAENAVKYGVRTSPGPMSLVVAARVEDQRLVIEIANTGRWLGDGSDRQEPMEGGAGVGLANVRQRLERLYPGRHRFQVGQVDGWVRARIELLGDGAPA